MAPIGTNTLIEHLLLSLAPITRNPPMVLSQAEADPGFRRWIHAVCPRVRVVAEPGELAEVVESYELSDAFLIVDPRCLPIHDLQLSALLRHYAEAPRVAHHLVALERTIGGTKERVSFDNNGRVRGIHRHYEQATWPFIAGIAATVVPAACGVLADGLISRSLEELRRIMIGGGVPSRDVPVEGGALDIAEESGMLAANELLILKATSARRQGERASAQPLYVGDGHSIHVAARLVGPLVIHAGARIEENATVLGPAVIGAGACIAAGAMVAHATVGPDCIVPSGRIVRDRAWFENGEGHGYGPVDHAALSYGERLARLSADPQENPHDHDQLAPARHRQLYLKRAVDITVAALSLAILTPLFGVIATVIWLESEGSIFYADKREGLRGRVFGCWKFRTMYTGASLAQRELSALDQTDGPHFKVDRDPRVTRVGRFLRATNLDEVPQLLNVLLGEMSLVGPRPSPFRENQVCVPWRDARLSVRPGITGFWQVCRHDRSAGDFHQWIEYDLLYVQYLAPWLDFKILVATILTLGGKVAHVPASWLLPAKQGRL